MAKAKQKAAILFGRVPAKASYDEQDVLVEAATVSGALSSLGYRPVSLPITLDLQRAVERLRRLSPLFVFNLVESLDGKDRLVHLAPALLDFLGLAYTGAPTEAVFLTSNKLLAKQLLRRSDMPTPDWLPLRGPELPEPTFPPPYIVKSVWEHASIGLTGASVARDQAGLGRELDRRMAGSAASELYLETYIEGREFNLAMIEENGAPRVLPPAEIRFTDYPDDKPKIVDYAAKWESGSPEYNNTPRRFDFPSTEEGLLAELRSMAQACWRLFGICGYARVDFRVDTLGRPWVLEVNPNPCLSPDAGFLAAAAQAGLGAQQVLRLIVRACLDRFGKNTSA